MEFEWDRAKELSNRKKHGLGFQDAARVFADPDHQTVFDGSDQHEERGRAIGLVQGLAVIVLAFTDRDQDGVEIVRIISARRATRQERNQYERNR